jgi:S1-C subfamily serine protease
MLARTTGSGDLASLFATVSRSVWLVLAARSAADLEAGTGVAVGSAVAVNLNALLTNCHVIGDRAFVWIKQGETIVESTVVHGDRETDRCILAAPKATLRPVPGMRRYNDLRVGESVYTIGSPRGLERSLGQGIISGLRQREQQRLIQTTAQISPGSSGGGLFDQDGNLLGLTTFRLKDSEGLNFAIALDEFFRP